MLLSEERKNGILSQLKLTGKVKVIDLAEEYEVSTETIRRDLDILEEKGLLQRVYGGAIKTTYEEGEPPFTQRTSVNHEAKIKIGKKAAEFVQDGDVIVIDVGTTTLEFARSIRDKQNLMILTNSIPVSSVLTEALNQNYFTGEILLLGGMIDPEQQSVSGYLTESVLTQFNIDKAFLSVGGVSISGGISDYRMNETHVSKQMLKASKEVFVLCDYSKFGVNTFCKMGTLDEVDAIICDQPLPREYKDHELLKELNWITA